MGKKHTSVVVRCPQCVAAGARSTVRTSGVSRTLACSQEYWDEDGRYHSHDPNRHTTRWFCSNGHVWAVNSYPVCPSCGWQFKETQVNIVEPRPPGTPIAWQAQYVREDGTIATGDEAIALMNEERLRPGEIRFTREAAEDLGIVEKKTDPETGEPIE